MYIHNLRDKIQEGERLRQENETFLNVFGLPLLILSLLIGLVFWVFSPAQAGAAWMSPSWNYKVKVEVNPNKVGTTTAVTSFPVYLDLAGMPTSFWTNASSTGADIRVTESDEVTETAFELVSFSTTTQRGELHFLADALATTSTSTFYIYYGNATGTAYATSSTYGASNVWHSAYKGMWHLSESSGSAFDSTVNINTATNTNSVAYTTGKIYNSASTTRASNQRLGAPDSASLSITSTTTISFWVNMTTTPASGQVYGLVTKDTAGASQRSYWLDYYNNSGTPQLRYGIHRDGGATNYAWSYINQTFATGTDYYVTVKTLPSNTIGTKFEFYVDGVYKGNGTAANNGTGATSVYDSLTATYFGAYASAGVYMNGELDELSIQSTSTPWSTILTEYNNESSTSTFFYIGPEEARTSSSTTYTSDEVFWFE